MERSSYRYFPTLLLVVLGGYLFFNRTFAWLHVPGIPLFAGELVIAVGVYETLGTRLAGAVVRRSAPLKAIVALMAVGMLHLAWAFPVWGLDAVRDSALWYYGVVAILVAVALAAEPGLLDRMTAAYLRVIPLFLLWAPVAVVLDRRYSDAVPTVPDSTTSLFSFKAADYAVLAGAAVLFVWLAQERVTPAERGRAHLATALGLVAVLVAGSQSRGGMVGAMVILLIGFLYVPHKGRIFYVATLAGVAVLAVMLVADIRFDLGRREISADQLLANAASVFGGDDADSELEGTVAWRLALWGEVLDDVSAPDRFFTGFGMGLNLAERYGFQGEDERQPLRNAHNSHLTLLARMGVTGMVLWVLCWVLLFGVLAARLGRPRRLAPGSELALMAWVLAVVAGFLVNAVFDPSLEGPQAALWLWTVVGVGVALAGRWVAPSRPAPAPARAGTAG